MTPLGRMIAERIALDGPMSIAEYMAECLLNPAHGYYATRDPFGAAGDFTTAPEISQMFGEMLGLCLAQTWSDQGRPDGAVLAELGPGRGTLIRDILRATGNIAGFPRDVHLIEASAGLRDVQRETLEGASVTWHDSVASLPDRPLLLVANEFFDALPIRQFQRADEGWCERRVHIRDAGLAFGLTGETRIDTLTHRLTDTASGGIVEQCSAAGGVVAALSARIEAWGGAALIFDYGDWRSRGDTFQALRRHEPVDPLAEPGLADLTAHVDFEALHAAARTASRMIQQGVLLERLGITARARALAAHLDGDALDNLIAAHRRLTHPDEMGNLFKALALFPAGAAPPPGFDP